jgi:hypothetical protein
MTSASVIRETPKGWGNCIPRSWVGKMTLRFWKCCSANEEVQRFAIEASKILGFDNGYRPFIKFAIVVSKPLAMICNVMMPTSRLPLSMSEMCPRFMSK